MVLQMNTVLNDLTRTIAELYGAEGVKWLSHLRQLSFYTPVALVIKIYEREIKWSRKRRDFHFIGAQVWSRRRRERRDPTSYPPYSC